MGKSKKSHNDSTVENGSGDESMNDSKASSWEERVKYLSPIASPLASKKMTKKIYKLAKKANGSQSVRKGLKEVQKSLRKGETGIVILAGDVSPMDIMSHMPVVCEEKDIPYCYTPSRQDLGQSMGSKRMACVIMIKEHESYKEDYQAMKEKITSIPSQY